ncbi:hypothetical protein ACOSQ2_006138 [Xanthoceras sorbifolium]
MISSKRLTEIARMWGKWAAMTRQRIAFTRNELLRMSEEEFGIPTNGPITLPCDSTFLKYVLSLVRGGISEDLEKSLLTSLATCHFSVSSLDQGPSNRQTLICSR